MASIRLTKQHRTEFVRDILKETFEPRWQVLIDKLTAVMDQRVKETHPLFCKSLKNLELRPYLSVSNTITPQYRGQNSFIAFRAPLYAAVETFDPMRVTYGSYLDFKSGVRNICVDVSHPPQVKTETRLGADGHSDIMELHELLWKDYTKARESLYELANSYQTAEKLAEDFPEYEKHLPKPVAKAMPLVVPVKDIRAKLAGVGVPPKKGAAK